MWILAAVVAYTAAYAACLAAVRVTRRRALGLDCALALAVLVCGEALVVHALSALSALARPGLLGGNALLVAAGGAVAWRRRDRLPPVRRPRLLHPAALAIAALGALALVAALAYVPNNWDSMTYHLARVAHWLQRRSAGVYPTNIARQIVNPPGAEYVVVGVQGISGTDRLDALVQLASWVILAASAPPLARTFGAPRRLAPWAALVVAAGPLAIQQASSTQNDLVAGALAVAAVASALPFLHRRPRWGAADLALGILVTAAGVLVKPTSVVVATPFLACAAVAAAPALRSRAGWRHVAGALPAVAIAAAVLVPYYRASAAVPGDPDLFAPYVYDGVGDLPDRLTNSVRALLRNVPVPLAAADRLSPAQTIGCDSPAMLCLERNRWFHEDYTGSTGPALVALAALLAGAWRLRRLPRRTALALACLAASWVLLQALFRDNTWTPRLHLAWFALAPASLGAFHGLGAGPGPRGARAAVALVALALVTHAAVAAVKSRRRPLRARALATASAPSSYYREGPPGVAGQHDAVLRALGASGCRRLGLLVTGDSYDYPLTWRAMQAGVEARHVVGPDPWPCAIFSDRGAPDGARWQAELDFLYVPAPEPGGASEAAARGRGAGVP